MAKTGTDEYKAERFRLKIAKSTYSNENFFESLPEQIKEFFSTQVPMEPKEIPVFGSFDDESIWYLATTRRIVWSTPAIEHQLRYSQIKSIEQTPHYRAQSVEELQSQEYRDQVFEQKLEWPWYKLIDSEDNSFEMLLAGASPLMSGIRFMINLEKIHPSLRDGA